MKIIKTVNELQRELVSRKNIGLVPTMGALHLGHVSLVKRAIAECETVVVSVFVNPTQFNDKGDLERYPRDLKADADLLSEAGAHILFAPSVDEVYPPVTSSSSSSSTENSKFKIQNSKLGALASVMEGARRPGHFDGVVQVVGRLFDIVSPCRAYFGEKDFQQLAIIRAMVSEQRRNVQIVGCPIVRTASGLAFSSRNALLSDDQRTTAAAIYRALSALRATIEAGGDVEKMVEKAISDINKNEYLCVEYVEVVDATTLMPCSGHGEFRICAAVQCGAVRLIDNV